MDAPQSIRHHDRHDPWPRRPDQPSVQCSIATATRRLDTALRVWDEDQAQARSQIKVAIAVLQGGTGKTPIQEQSPGRVAHGLVPWQVREVRQFIDASLESKIRLKDCATRTRLSAGHFSRAFKATFGSTLLGYVHRRRIERAQQLMLISGKPLSEIALSCGFADQAHYCRVFRAMVGLSPGAWRRQNMELAPNERSESFGTRQGQGSPAEEASIRDVLGRT